MSTPDTDGQQVRPFAAILTELRGGRAHAEVSEALAQLVTAVETTGKGGTVTLTITVKPVAKNDGSTVTVTDQVRVKAPTVDPKPTVFFLNGGSLSRDNPHQPQLPLQLVETPTRTTELKEANAR